MTKLNIGMTNALGLDLNGAKFEKKTFFIHFYRNITNVKLLQVM
jgi:hypothetical protein